MSASTGAPVSAVAARERHDAGSGAAGGPRPQRTSRGWVHLVVAAALLAIGAVVVAFFQLPPHLIMDTGAAVTAAGPVTPATSLVQPIAFPQRSRVTGLEVLLATWGKPANNTHDHVAVFNDRGVKLAALSLPPGSLADNEYVHVALQPAVDLSAGSRLYIAVSSSDGSASESHSITAWYNPGAPQSRFYVLPRSLAASSLSTTVLQHAPSRVGSLCVHVYGLGPRLLSLQRLGAAGAFVVCAIAAGLVLFGGSLRRLPVTARLGRLARRLLRAAGRMRVPHAYLIAALSWGIIMVFLVPPFQVPDEPAHYFRAWSVAELQVFAHRDQTVDIPSNVATLPSRVGSAVVEWSAASYSTHRARSLLWEPLSKTMQRQTTSAAGYSPVGYLPQAAGIEVARLLGHSPLLGLYLARAFNLLFSALIVFFALRLVPFGKSLMAIVALLPMSVSLMASASPDALVISGAMLVTALAVNFSRRERVSAHDMVWLGVAAAVMLNVKPGYAVLALLALMITPRQIGGARRWLVGEASVIGIACAVGGLVMITAPSASSASLASLGVPGVNQHEQLSLLAHNPLIFAQVVITTFDGIGLWLAQSAYGLLGWLTVGLPLVGLGLAGLAVVLLLSQNEPIPTTPWQRGVLASVALLLAGTVSLAMYVTWTSVGAPAISGLQGRYFIPAIVPALFALYGIRLTRERTLVSLLLVVAIVLALTTLKALVVSYY